MSFNVGLHYVGWREGTRRPQVWILDGTRTVRKLTPLPSLELRNHSPDGFAWGYCGSGPAQLALAILLEHTNSRAKALELYQEFKAEIVAGFPVTCWAISGAQIDEWLAKQSPRLGAGGSSAL